MLTFFRKSFQSVNEKSIPKTYRSGSVINPFFPLKYFNNYFKEKLILLDPF